MPREKHLFNVYRYNCHCLVVAQNDTLAAAVQRDCRYFPKHPELSPYPCKAKSCFRAQDAEGNNYKIRCEIDALRGSNES
jgi:hypothetical protein